MPGLFAPYPLTAGSQSPPKALAAQGPYSSSFTAEEALGFPQTPEQLKQSQAQVLVSTSAPLLLAHL